MTEPPHFAEIELRDAVRDAEDALQLSCDVSALLDVRLALDAKLNLARNTLGPQLEPTLVDHALALARRFDETATRVAFENADAVLARPNAEWTARRRAADDLARTRAHLTDPDFTRRALALETALLAPALESVCERTERADPNTSRDEVLDAIRATEHSGRASPAQIERALRALLALDERTHGPAAPETSASATRLAQFLARAGRRDEALHSLDAGLERARAAGAESHAPVLALAAQRLLLRAQTSAGDGTLRAEIRALLQRIDAIRGMRRKLADERFQLSAAHDRLVAASGDPAVRERNLRTRADEARRASGRNSGDYAGAAWALAKFLLEQKRFDEAEQWFTTARAIAAMDWVAQRDEAPSPLEIELDRVDLALARGDAAAANARLAAVESALPRVAGMRHAAVEARRARVDAAIAAQRGGGGQAEAVTTRGPAGRDGTGAGAVAGAGPERLRHPKLGLVGVVVARDGEKVRLRMDDGSERVFLADKLVREG